MSFPVTGTANDLINSLNVTKDARFKDTINPMCNILSMALTTLLAELRALNILQETIKNQIDEIVALGDINTLLNALPDVNLIFNPEQINEVLRSCPGIFSDLPTFKLELTKIFKEILNNWIGSGNPLGKLLVLKQVLDDILAPVKSKIEKVLAYLTCLNKICGLLETDFTTLYQHIFDLNNQFNLDENGKPILNPVVTNVLTAYQTRIDNLRIGQDIINTYSSSTPITDTAKDMGTRFKDIHL